MDCRSVLEPDESGRVLDRLAGLEQVIAPELVAQALAETNTANRRRCKISSAIMIWVVLAMGLFTDVPIRQVYKLTRRFRFGEKTPCRSALCQGRQRLGTAPLRRLFQLTASPMGRRNAAAESCFYKGYRLMSIDGTVYNAPDAPENESAFGRPRGGASSDSQGAFPQVGKLALVESGSRAEVGLVVRPLSAAEDRLAPRLCQYMTPEMLVLLDCGFYGYPMLRRVIDSGAQVLCRVPAGPKFEVLKRLADGSYLTRLRPSRGSRRHRERNSVLVRVIEYTLDDPQRTGHGEVHRLITTLLDETECPAEELIIEYHRRWEQELGYDEQKTHQDPPRSTKPTHLRSRTAAGVVQELFALSLAHYAVCKIKFDAALLSGIAPDRVSFTGTIQVLRCRLPECPRQSVEGIEQWYRDLLCEIAEEPLPPRRNRVNPRVIKRPRPKWNTKKQKHYDLPPLTKQFRETVVMLN